MTGHGILRGDIVLIRQKTGVELRDIAAFVIMTPELEPVEVIKQYYYYTKRTNMKHWLLRASNPSSEHLVVIPSGVDEEAILELYSREVQSGRMLTKPKYYTEAELTIAGKYVGLVRKI
jgi:hypothetical protein